MRELRPMAVLIAFALAACSVNGRTYWIRGLPPPDDPVGVVVTIVGGALLLFLFWFLLNAALRVLAFVLRPLIRWLNKPL